MSDDDKTTHRERLRSDQKPTGNSGHHQPDGSDGDGGEASCIAFGYLRGIRDQALAVEFRLRDGKSTWFPYGWLGTWSYNPCEGLLLKFSGDIVYLVLIRGSNLDKALREGVDLTHAGLQRHRVVWVREMSKEDIRKVGETGPTIDSIQISGFASQAELKEWLNKTAPSFSPI